MPRKPALIHGYTDSGQAFSPLRDALASRGVEVSDINISSHVTLNNEITTRDVAEGPERALTIIRSSKRHPDSSYRSFHSSPQGWVRPGAETASANSCVDRTELVAYQGITKGGAVDR
jgi:hypothetical protein